MTAPRQITRAGVPARGGAAGSNPPGTGRGFGLTRRTSRSPRAGTRPGRATAPRSQFGDLLATRRDEGVGAAGAWPRRQARRLAPASWICSPAGTPKRRSPTAGLELGEARFVIDDLRKL